MARATGKPKKKPRGKPFPKGTSGNPGGKPKFGRISDAIRFMLEMPNDEFEAYEPKNPAEAIAKVQIQQALKKKGKASVELVVNRAEGLPVATTRASVEVLRDSVVEFELIAPPFLPAPPVQIESETVPETTDAG